MLAPLIRRGKGYVVPRAVSEIDVDIYVLADGDGTYDASVAPELVDKLWSSGSIWSSAFASIHDSAYRVRHRFGNHLFNGIIRQIRVRSLVLRALCRMLFGAPTR